MAHVVRSTDWCEIDIDTTAGKIFFQERWKYNWVVAAGLPAWTYIERRTFHTKLDRAIWATWSNRILLDVSGRSEVARQHSAKGMEMNLDVKWVTNKQHWTVNITKVAAGAFVTSSVVWDTRTISLDTNDTTAIEKRPGTAPGVKQIPGAHEFGHAVGNTSRLGRGDEYGAAHAHAADTRSIMHIGNELRARHVRTIIEELNRMIPDTVFAVKRIN